MTIFQQWMMMICEEAILPAIKKFDDATAILVGDAFQSLAFEILSDKKLIQIQKYDVD